MQSGKQRPVRVSDEGGKVLNDEICKSAQEQQFSQLCKTAFAGLLMVESFWSEKHADYECRMTNSGKTRVPRP